MPSTPSNPSTDPTGPTSEQQALQEALARLLAPVAQLAVARGLPFAAVEEMLKLAFVQAADRAHPDLLAHRKVSRITTATGINRREVTRLTQQAPRTAGHSRSLASELFGHWRTQKPYRGADDQPLALPRQGAAPSFESLAQCITRDVHPRSLLDELLRLGMATWDEAADTVALTRDIFVPQGDRVQQLGFLGLNAGDHLSAAVDNVLRDNHAHFEQAIFATGLSAASLESVRPVIRAQWQTLLAALVPALETRVAADSTVQPAPQGRLRIGLYTYQEGADLTVASGEAPLASAAPTPGTPRKPSARTRKP